ncbi:hypothetical protein R1sor_019604 [Riccia sorocarpa]|uniref:Myb/SANT-like DNA-binding domain-containing protein n=1 Tax=Riccia sorocarpa TaxID=122646 RepID=A0ABD3ID49_9MARC
MKLSAPFPGSRLPPSKSSAVPVAVRKPKKRLGSRNFHYVAERKTEKVSYMDKENRSFRHAMNDSSGSEAELEGCDAVPVANIFDSQPSESDVTWPSGRIWEMLDEYKRVKIDHKVSFNFAQRHWMQVVRKVNQSKTSNIQQSLQQVKNKMDSLKKKFKVEKKHQNTTGQGPHPWEYYDIMYDLFGTSSKIVGIPNASDNGQCTQPNQTTTSTPRPTRTVVDLNISPPTSAPRDSSKQRSESRSPAQEADPGQGPEVHSPLSPRRFRSRGVTGQKVKSKRSPAGRSNREIAEAMREFTDAYKETKRARQEGEKERTALLASMINLRRRDMFSE